MAIIVPSGGTAAAVSSATSNTLAVTIQLPISGNLLVLSSTGFDAVSSIAGGGVATWTKIIGLAGDINHNECDIWYGIVDGTPSTGVTVTYASSMGFRAAHTIELNGAQKATDTTTPYANDAQGNADSKTITTTNDNCIIISSVGAANGTTGATGPTGYTALTPQVASGSTLGTAYLIQTTHGLSTMNWSAFGTSSAWPGLGGVAILPAGGGAGLAYDQDKQRRVGQAVKRSAYFMLGDKWDRHGKTSLLVPPRRVIPVGA